MRRQWQVPCPRGTTSHNRTLSRGATHRKLRTLAARKKIFILWPAYKSPPELLGQGFVVNFATYTRVYTVIHDMWQSEGEWLVKLFNVKTAPCIMEMLKQLRVPGMLLACHKALPLEDILVEIKLTRRPRLDTGGKEWRGRSKNTSKTVTSFSNKAKDRPEFHLIPVPSKAWSLVGIDCVTNLLETARGNKNICAASNDLTILSLQW